MRTTIRLIAATCALLALLLLAGALPATQAQAAPGRDIAKKSFPSVAVMIMYNEKGKPESLGSGFVVLPGILATNYHVVQGAAKGEVTFLGDRKAYPILGVVGLDAWADLALVAIADRSRKPLPVGLASRMQVGDQVYVIGNPKGLVGTFSEGVISAVRRRDNRKDFTFQMSAPISTGSSGGPVLNEQGEVIGVSVSTILSGQNLNFAIPVSYVSSLMRSMTPVRRLASVPAMLQYAHEKSEPSNQSADSGKRPKLAMAPGMNGINLTNFLWSDPPFTRYSFSIKNNLPQPITEVRLHTIFYDAKGEIFDNVQWVHTRHVPAGLAARASAKVDPEVFKLCSEVKVRVVDVVRGR